MNARHTYRLITTVALTTFAFVLPTRADGWVFNPTDDTQVTQPGSNSNYGHWQHMCVRNKYGGGGSWEVDSLVRFDISSIPDGTNITSATLNLYYFAWADNNPAGRPYTCYRITSDWDESTVTYNTKPTWLPPGQWTDSVDVPGSTGRWMSWDVTADVQMFVSGTATNYGWSIMDEKYWGGGNIPYAKFRTKEYDSYIPYLEVIPAPGTLALLAIGGLAIGRRRR